MHRRLGNFHKRLQRRNERGQRTCGAVIEQRELPILGDSDGDFLRLRREAVDAQDHARAFALELYGVVTGTLDLVLRVEAAEHPADRRRLVRRPFGIDRPRDDQPVDRTRHRDVIEAEALRSLLFLASLLYGVVGIGTARLARDRIVDAEAEAPVGQGQDLVRGRRCSVATRICDDYDLELQTFRRVDRQKPDGVSTFLLRHCFQLTRADGFLVAYETYEPFHVGTAQFLVRAREP